MDLEGQGDIDGLIFNLEFSSDDPAGGFSLTYLDPLGAELAGAPAIEVFPNAILSLPLPYQLAVVVEEPTNRNVQSNLLVSCRLRLDYHRSRLLTAQA